MDIDYTCILLLRNVWFWTKIRLALGEEVWVHWKCLNFFSIESLDHKNKPWSWSYLQIVKINFSCALKAGYRGGKIVLWVEYQSHSKFLKSVYVIRIPVKSWKYMILHYKACIKVTSIKVCRYVIISSLTLMSSLISLNQYLHLLNLSYYKSPGVSRNFYWYIYS